MNFDFKKITDFGKINMDNVSDTFKNPGSGINASSIRTPSPDDLTTIFTDIKVAAMEFLESMISGAKKSTLGASFMENASQIIGLAIVILGFVLYIQIQVGNEQAEGGRRENKYATSIVDDIDVDKPSNKISKKINIELFTPKGDNDGGGKSVNPLMNLPNWRDEAQKAERHLFHHWGLQLKKLLKPQSEKQFQMVHRNCYVKN